ncbi:hypothetical protein OG824_31750 [Streptomyces prunicolor]|uniref:hypothetical protein n=1 Tax=Streptomyces prunicolor TaxID=67348 RepID=UPI00225B7EE4|nr:hypothetical protein [Streptomyces prunicolor]MCX5239785.1 hypothetical protein [Streptomyces prunicolor]
MTLGTAGPGKSTHDGTQPPVGDATQPTTHATFWEHSMNPDPRLKKITEVIESLIPGSVPTCLSVDVKETLSVTGCVSNTWTGSPEGLAEKIFGALFTRSDSQEVVEGQLAAAGMTVGATALAATIAEAERYLERGEPELALARLRSDKPLPPCGAPGVMPEHLDCARSGGHRGACSDDPDYTEGPHECPALPEQLYAVATVGAEPSGVHFVGLYEEREAAADHAAGFAAFAEGLNDRYVQPAPGCPGEMLLELPAENQHAGTGVQLAVVVPLQVLPDPRAAEEWAAEGMATCMEYDDDYGKDLDYE